MTKYITKKTLLAVFILFCVTGVLFYLLGTYPLFDYSFLKEATGAYTMNGIDGTPVYVFSDSELDIVLDWAKTIVPTERIGQLLLECTPTITITDGGEKLSVYIDGYSPQYDLILYHNSSIYGAVCEDSAFGQVKEILRSK